MEGGLPASLFAGRRGRTTSSPPQFGQVPPSTPSAHGAQKVHSKEQMRASPESGGRSRSQHSQFGLSCSMGGSGTLVGSRNKASHRRKPVSSAPILLDSGIRRNGDRELVRRFLIALAANRCNSCPESRRRILPARRVPDTRDTPGRRGLPTCGHISVPACQAQR